MPLPALKDPVVATRSSGYNEAPGLPGLVTPTDPALPVCDESADRQRRHLGLRVIAEAVPADPAAVLLDQA